jgi:hypothetical protein
MADETAEKINLKFLAGQNERVLNEIASFREDMTVLTAIAMRLESAVDSLNVEVRALSSSSAGSRTGSTSSRTLSDGLRHPQ